MQEFAIYYHLINGRTVIDKREYESLAIAMSTTSKCVKENHAIGIIKSEEHVLEVKTSCITHYEVMTLEKAKLREKIQSLPPIGL